MIQITYKTFSLIVRKHGYFFYQQNFFYWIMFIFVQDVSNSGKVGRGAEHKLYDRVFEPDWVLFSIFRSDLFSAPRRGQVSAG